jgi:hypothetical protein
VRRRDGVTERWCWEHKQWLPETAFKAHTRTASFETICRDCAAAKRRRNYEANRERIAARNRAHYLAVRGATRDSLVAPSSHPGRSMIDAGIVRKWLLETTSPSVSALARQASAHPRVVTNIASGITKSVKEKTAERIARATGHLDDFYELLPTGIERWSKHSTHCLHCGRFDRPHWARGLCLPCYDLCRYWQRSGRAAPPTKSERWSLPSPLGCRACGTRRKPHQARGLCTGCYASHLTIARRRQTSIAELLDSLGHHRVVRNALYDLSGGIAAARRSAA